MSSAPNILQPLTLNSSNGLLETIFPVDQTPSPVSPLGASEQENFGDSTNCRRRLALQSRPFSEMYSEEFVPLDDDDVTSSPQVTRSENAPVENGAAEADTVGDNRASSSLGNSDDVESPDETIDQGQDSQNGLDDVDVITGQETTSELTPLQGPAESSQDIEHQPMEIPEENNDVNTSEVEMDLSAARQRTSVGSSIGSIELTEDSPLRILEESERVREERIALSNENLLQDATAESDDELEQMDITDETVVVTERDSSHNSDYSMEDALTGGNTTQSTLIENGSLETPMADRETDLLEAASNVLLDEDIDDQVLSPLQDIEGSRASPPVVECLAGPSVAAALTETQPATEEIVATEGNLQMQSEDSQNDPELTVEPVTRREDSERDEPMSLLEYVDQIFAGEAIEQSMDNAMIVESVGETTQVGIPSTTSGAGTTESAQPSNVDPSVGTESSLAISSVTLPMEASEPVCLNATSLQSASASEMLVDTPQNLAVNSRVSERDSNVPQRPPRGKRLSRSSSDPRSTHSRRAAERARHASRANQGENSPRLSRPPLVRRVTEPTQAVQPSVVNSEVVQVNTGVLSQVIDPSNTTVVTPVTDAYSGAEVSPQVVMAVPLSPPPQRGSSSSTGSGPSPVVVADVVAEAAALVTPLPSPDSVSEGTSATSENHFTVVAVGSDTNTRRAEVESSTSRSSSNEFVLPVPNESRQPSSAPSTLQRDNVSAVASMLANESQAPRRTNSSQDNSSSVVYATPLTELNRELPDQQSASFPRQSGMTRVTALSGNRRRRSSSGSGYTVTRDVSEESQSLPRSYGQTVSVAVSSSPVAAVSATLNSDQSGSTTTDRENHDSPSLGATSLPGPSSRSANDVNQSREAIQSILRTYCANSSQTPRGRPPAIGQPTVSTSSAQEPEPSRRPSQGVHRSGNRRSSGRRQQGNAVHVSIQDQQQTREQQSRPGQQASEEDEPLPSSKEFKEFFRITRQ